MAYRNAPFRYGPFRSRYVDNREKKNSKPAVKLGTKSQHAGYFMPMLESFAARDELNEVVKNRVVKSCDLLDAGVPLFPNDFRKEHCIAEITEQYKDTDAAQLETMQEVHFSVA